MLGEIRRIIKKQKKKMVHALGFMMI